MKNSIYIATSKDNTIHILNNEGVFEECTNFEYDKYMSFKTNKEAHAYTESITSDTDNIIYLVEGELIKNHVNN